MKFLAAIFFTFLLAACGGGEPSAPELKAPLPFRLASPVSGDPEVALHLYQALYGKAPSYTQLNTFKSQIAANGAASWVNSTAAAFNNLSNTAFAAMVLNNIGITTTSLTATAVFGSSKQAYDGLLAGFTDYLNLVGVASRGVVAAQLTKIISNLEFDTQFGVYGPAAIALNKQIGANNTYSINPNNLTDAKVAATAAPEGLYAGVLQGAVSPAFQLLILENGDSWALFGTQTGPVFYVAGFAQGMVAFSNGVLSSASMKDFGFAPALGGSLTGTYDSVSKALSVTLIQPGRTIVASGGAPLGSLYDYNQVPALSAVSGNWSVTTGQGEGVSLAIASSGAITANSSTGCRISGALTPRSSGKNVFNIAATFGPAPCALPGLVVSGIAISYPLSNGQRQIAFAATDATRQFGISAFGVR